MAPPMPGSQNPTKKKRPRGGPTPATYRYPLAETHFCLTCQARRGLVLVVTGGTEIRQCSGCGTVVQKTSDPFHLPPRTAPPRPAWDRER